MIRHGEKPVDGADGVTEAGAADPESLMPKGWQRAGALTQLLGNAGDDGMVPNVIFAAGVGPGSRSRRSIETVTPLVAKLRERGELRFVTDYLRADHQPLADGVAAQTGVVLIAWEHKQLPAIAALVAPGAPAPDAWDEGRFDLLWIFDRAGAGWTFEERPQTLLAGDAH